MPSPPVPSPGATTTTFQVGTYTPLTDTFTLVFDLNDFSATWVHWDSIKFSAPEEIDVRGNNIRTPGERISRIQYKNGHVTCAVMIRATTPQLVLNKIHSLRQATRNENLPYVIRMAPPGAQNFTYFDVAKCVWTPPYDPQAFNAGFQTQVVLDFECQPGMRGDRLVLQNYAINPGFEGPCGGTNAPAVQVFSDNFANVNAYAVQAGGAPTLNPANTYVDIVDAQFGAGLIGYYRLDDTGTTALDISGLNASGNINGSPTTGVAGLISGDTDTCMTFNGTTQNISGMPLTQLPTGAGTVTLLAWVKITATPAGDIYCMAIGDGGTATHWMSIGVQGTSGKALVTNGTTTAISAAALTLNTPHLIVGTYDGTTLRIYLDNAAAVTAAASNALTNTRYRIASDVASSAGHWFAGTLDEVCLGNVALSSTAVGNIWTAGNSGASGTLTGAMTIPASARVAFGSPAWAALQNWQTRFRYTSSLEWRWILHLMDTSDFLYVRVRGSGIEMHHVVAGTDHLLATQALTLVHEAWYWLQVTQFPTVAGQPAYIQAVLLYDSNGTVGAQVATVGPTQTFDAVTSLSGRPQLQGLANALTIGGNFSNVHTVSLFGPGGWYVQGDPATYSPSSAAWEQTAANCIPIGTSALVPVTSLAAARVDCPPAGTVSCYWLGANTTSLATLQATGAIPTTNGVQFSASVYVKSSGMGVACSLQLNVWEYTSAGAFVAEKSVQSVTGNQAAWTQLTGSITTDATTAYVLLALRVNDANAGASANGTVWFENAQLWLTANGASMPYCELRFMVSPAQIVVSGLIGDMPAGAHLSLGTYLPASSVSSNTNLQVVLGQRAQPTAQSALSGKFVMGPTLDSSNSLAGWYGFVSNGTVLNLQPDAFEVLQSLTTTNGQIEANVVGVYHFFARVFSGESAGNLSKISLQTLLSESNVTLQSSLISGPLLTPLSTSSLWNVVDLGQVTVPPIPAGNARDLTQVSADCLAVWTDGGAGARVQADWWALIPVDASLILAVVGFNGLFNNPHNYGTGWFWTYFDGLARQQSKSGGASLGTGSGSAFTGTPIPTPANAIGGVSGTNSLSLTTSASPYLTLDPTQAVAGVSGINEFTGFVGDQNQGAWPTLPLFAEILYSPLYTYPR